MYLPTFSATSDVRYWVNHIHRYAAWLTDMEEKQTELDTEISNMADNAGITQSQERDTRYRRIQEVNSLCTDRGPL